MGSRVFSTFVMDCPHCMTRNPAGAANCVTCHAPLGAAGAKVVAPLTPVDEDSNVTIVEKPIAPRSEADDSTLDGSSPPPLGIPSRWSMPASGQSIGGTPTSHAALKAGSLLGDRYE